ncbi:MAG: ABC transporter substrate-binding protein [Proteobacteria bacterium]|nr:ABC transporter substrate-binding protein [Pseudomonadota bacterium]
MNPSPKTNEGQRRDLVDVRGVPFHPLSRPCRVVSLVPSWTETLFYLGLTEREILGRTDYCIHPRARVGEIEKLGGPRDPAIERILKLAPDLIVMDREENRKEDVERLDGHWDRSRVFVTGLTTVDHALNYIEQLGHLFQTQKRARKLIDRVNSLLDRIIQKNRGTVAYLTWLDPIIAVGSETYIEDVLAILGYQNVFTSSNLKDLKIKVGFNYPTITLEDLIHLKPDAIFLSTEPFPFRRRHIDRLRSQIDRIDPEYATEVDIRIVNGEYFSWYGSRMIAAFRYFVNRQVRL